MTKRSLMLAATLFAALGGPARAVAQDAHYWTYGYGPVGQLTEGVLVGGVEDLSAVYYNPGALALIERPRFVIGLTSVELANIDVPGAAGDGLNFDQGIVDVVPSMVAGSVGANEGQKNHFAFAFLSRHDSDWDLGYGAAQVSSASADGSAGFGRFRQRLAEYWVGGTWSRRLNDRLAIGVSPFFAYRAQRSRRSLTLEEVSADASSTAFVATESEYNHMRLLAKAGLAWRPGRWELGATVTAPGVKLWGDGKSAFNASLSSLGREPFLSAAAQTGLDADYHAPWAAAGGATFRHSRGAIHTTLEWFSAVAAYDILQPEPAPVAGSSQTVPLTYRGEARSVFCYGIGLEHHLGERVVLYGGAAHNESAYVANRDAFASWDLTDLTGGLTFDRGRAKLALGVGYAWGTNDLPQVIAPPDQAPATREAHFSRWTLSIGASFGRQ